jgi:hypothetical protein
MGDIVLHMHNKFSYPDSKDQLRFLATRILSGDSKPFKP